MKLKGDNEQIIITAITERIAPAGEWQYVGGGYLIPIRTIHLTHQDIFEVVFSIANDISIMHMYKDLHIHLINEDVGTTQSIPICRTNKTSVWFYVSYLLNVQKTLADFSFPWEFS